MAYVLSVSSTLKLGSEPMWRKSLFVTNSLGSEYRRPSIILQKRQLISEFQISMVSKKARVTSIQEDLLLVLINSHS